MNDLAHNLALCITGSLRTLGAQISSRFQPGSEAAYEVQDAIATLNGALVLLLNQTSGQAEALATTNTRLAELEGAINNISWGDALVLQPADVKTLLTDACEEYNDRMCESGDTHEEAIDAAISEAMRKARARWLEVGK